MVHDFGPGGGEILSSISLEYALTDASLRKERSPGAQGDGLLDLLASRSINKLNKFASRPQHPLAVAVGALWDSFSLTNAFPLNFLRCLLLTIKVESTTVIFSALN